MSEKKCFILLQMTKRVFS